MRGKKRHTEAEIRSKMSESICGRIAAGENYNLPRDNKLSEYKPLAKVEELEESNYNMIDNVLNNEKSKKEEKRSTGRISIKEKLAEKKAMIEHRDKGEKLSPDKDAEKKSHREI